MYDNTFPLTPQDLTLWNQHVGKMCCPLHRRGDFLTCVVDEPAPLEGVSMSGQAQVAQWFCRHCRYIAPVTLEEAREALGMTFEPRDSLIVVDEALGAIREHPARNAAGALHVRWRGIRPSWFRRRGPAVTYDAVVSKHAAVVQVGDWVLASVHRAHDDAEPTVRWDSPDREDDQTAVRVTQCVRQGNTQALLISTSGGRAVVHDDALLAVITDGLGDPTLLDNTWFLPIPETLPQASEFPPQD